MKVLLLFLALFIASAQAMYFYGSHKPLYNYRQPKRAFYVSPESTRFDYESAYNY